MSILDAPFPAKFYDIAQCDYIPKPVTKFLAIDRDLDECWPWDGDRDSHGYGRIGYRIGGKIFHTGAHRFIYAVCNGPIPRGLVIDHLCKNTLCCNRSHLEAVSQKINNERGTPRNIIECPRGHKYLSDNLIPSTLKMGARGCLTCSRTRARKRYAILGEAVASTGLTWAEYINRYGQSEKLAMEIARGGGL